MNIWRTCGSALDICEAPQLCARTKYIRSTLGGAGVLPLWGSWVMQACILRDAAIQGSCRKMVAWVRMTMSPDLKSIGLVCDLEQAVMGLPLMPIWLKIEIAAVASSQPFISFSFSFLSVSLWLLPRGMEMKMQKWRF